MEVAIEVIATEDDNRIEGFILKGDALIFEKIRAFPFEPKKIILPIFLPYCLMVYYNLIC